MRTDVDLSDVRWHAGALNNGAIFGLTYRLVSVLPKKASYGIGYAGTWLAYRLIREGTTSIVENLRQVRPEASEAELRRLALLTYRSYARDTIDFIRGITMTTDAMAGMMANVESRALDETLTRGRGVVLAGGHFGNWELGGLVLRRLHGHDVVVVAKSEASAVVGDLRRRMRDSLGIETLEIGRTVETALRIRKALSANRIVAMLLDRPIGRDRVDVTFFNRRTAFLRTPAMIAQLSGAPILPAFMCRQSDNRFVGHYGTPIEINPADPVDEAVAVATQNFASQLEAQIRVNPQLWYQFYPYWSHA